MDKSHKQILTEAKALIADKANWCQGYFALDNTKLPVVATSEEAVCRCSLGALGAAAGIDPQTYSGRLKPMIEGLDRAAIELAGRTPGSHEEAHSIVDLNDGDVCLPGMTEHEAVMAAFDLAIERAPA